MYEAIHRRARRVMIAATLAAVAACGGDDGPTGGGNPGSIQVAATPATLAVQQGTTGTVNAQVTRAGGYSGAVNVAVSGLPAGITTTITPSQLTGATTSAAIAVAVANTVAPGAYTATITASGTGIANTTAQYQVTVTAAPDFALALTPTTLSVAQQSSGTTAVAITRTNFAGNVTLALEGAPAGVTATFDPAASTTNTSALTIAVAANVAPGNYALTVKGSSPGLPDRTAPLALTVTVPAFTITPSPNALTVQQGNSGASVITIARTNFAGNVTLSLQTPPAGITGTFAPATTNGATANLSLTVAANTAPGEYILVVRGAAAGLVDRVANISLTVTAAPGSILVAVAPAALTVQQGANGAATVTITRNNFPGNVTLSASNVPAGVAVTFAPATTTTNVSTATIAVGQGTATGVYPISIEASGAGGTTALTTLTLTVAPPAQGGNTVWEFCSVTDTPVFFAVQDGNGAWQRITPTTTGGSAKFAFTLTQGRGGVAYVTEQQTIGFSRDASAVAAVAAVATSHSRIRLAQSLRKGVDARLAAASARRRTTFGRAAFATAYSTDVVYGTTAELTTLGSDNCNDTQPTKAVNASVAGVDGGEVAVLSLGGATTQFNGGAPGDVEFLGVPFGPVDLVGTRAAFASPPDKVILQRNLNIPNGGSLPAVIDFDGASAFAPATATATVTNSLNDELFLSTLFGTANGETGFLAQDQLLTTETQRPWYGIPTARLANGDLHGLFLFSSPDFLSATTQRLIFQYVAQVSNATLALGPNISAPTTSIAAAGSYPRLRFQGTLPTEYRSAVSISLEDEDAIGNNYSITATGAYMAQVGGNAAYDVVMPDLAVVNGFPAAARLLAGANSATVQAVGWNGTGIVTLRPSAGDLLRAAVRSVSVNVP